MSLEWIQSHPGSLPSIGFYQVGNLLPPLAERRLQKMVPKKRKYYDEHTKRFLKHFIKEAEIPPVKADVDLLEKTTDFWGWYESQQKKFNCYQPFFQNPITKSFYLDYVYKKGDSKYWFIQALRLVEA